MKKILYSILSFVMILGLISCGGGSSTGPSDNPISSIEITEPNGGETFTKGTTQPVTWNYEGTGTVKIELIGGTSVIVIENSINCDGSYNWEISESIETGTEYKIKITSTEDSTISDESDGVFELTKSAQELSNEGWQEIDSGSYSAAFDKFDEAIVIDSSLGDAYIGKAVAMLNMPSYVESDVETLLETNVIGVISDDESLKAAAGILVEINKKDTAEYVNIHTNYYYNSGILNDLTAGWDYISSINNDLGTSLDIKYLKGYNINLSLGEVFIKIPEFPDARTVVDKVLNYSGTLPTEALNLANSLDAQLDSAGF